MSRDRCEPIQMPYAGRNIPNISIEVNQNCNLECRACYKDKFAYTKPLVLIRDEIDLAARERNLQTISITGGEPTLHPQLPEVIEYAKSKGVITFVLSNGLILDDALLARYRRAGLDWVLIHIDAGQGRPDVPAAASERELDDLRRQLAARVVSHGMKCGLVITLYRSTLGDFPGFVDLVLSEPNVEAALAVCCMDAANNARLYDEDRAEVVGYLDEVDDIVDEQIPLVEADALLRREMGMRPMMFLPSDRCEDDQRWLVYASLSITDDRGRASYLHLFNGWRQALVQGPVSVFFHLHNELYQHVHWNNLYGMTPGQASLALFGWSWGVSTLRPRTVARTARFLARLLRPASRIQPKFLILQQPPTITADGEIETCLNCPDATVRNGEIIPMCIADLTNPIQP